MTNVVKFSGLVFLCLVWGLNWIAIKISLQDLPPIISAASRFFLASLVLIFYMKWKGLPLKFDKREFKLLLVTAFLTYATDYGLIYWAEQYLSAGVTAIFFSTFALFTAIFSNFIFKSETFSRNKFTGLLTGLVGIALVFYDQLALTRFSLVVIMACAAVIIAGASAAAATVIVKKFLGHMNPVILSFHQLWMGTVFLGIAAAAAEDPREAHFGVRALLAVIYMAVMSSAVAFAVYYKLLREMSAVSLSFTIYIIPVVALLGDFVFMGEVIPLGSFTGMFIIFSGIWISRLDKKQGAG
jgi:drug/metabolite transporter (DMT)-like permease